MSASTFVHDGRIYTVGGSVEGRVRSADVTMYDPQSQTWIARSLLPDGRKTPVAGFIGDTLQVATGNGPSLMSATNWSGIFDGSWETRPTLGVWSPMAAAMGEVAGGMIGDRLYLAGEGSGGSFMYMDMSLPRWIDFGIAQRPFDGDHHAAEVVGGKLYLFGGIGGGSPGKVQVYDPLANTWTVKADMPFAAGSAASAVIGGKVYVAGGIVGSETTNQAAVYDPVANTWQSIAPMPQGRNHAASATDGGKLYVFGGRDGGNTLSNGFDTVQIYDPATNAWRSSAAAGSPLAPLPQARGGMGKAAFSDGEFYVIGGETNTGPGATPSRVYARVDIYDPACNTWRRGEDMPTARHGIFPVERAGRIYVAGGGDRAGGGSDTDELEVYDPPAKPSCTPVDLGPDSEPDPGTGDPGTGDPGTSDPGTSDPGTPAAGGGTPATPPAQGGNPAPRPSKLASRLRARFAAGRASTRIRTLDALSLRAGTRLEVRCRGRGCPKGTARYRVSRTRAKLALRSKKLRAAKLRPGAVLEVRITRAGSVGLVIAHRVRARKAPVRTTRCLPPGAAKPVRCS
jgi:N-acetylneuraminic acid mutarotase